MTRRTLKWMAGFWLLAGAAVAADTTAGPVAAMPQAHGDATRQWLDRQRQGSQAAAKPQTLPGPVMEQVYERYRKSFAHPVPERFESERLGAGGSSR